MAYVVAEEKENPFVNGRSDDSNRKLSSTANHQSPLVATVNYKPYDMMTSPEGKLYFMNLKLLGSAAFPQPWVRPTTSLVRVPRGVIEMLSISQFAYHST